MRIRRITATAVMTALMGALSFVFTSPALAESVSQVDQSSTVQVGGSDILTVTNQVTSTTTVDGTTTTVTSDTTYVGEPVSDASVDTASLQSTSTEQHSSNGESQLSSLVQAVSEVASEETAVPAALVQSAEGTPASYYFYQAPEVASGNASAQPTQATPSTDEPTGSQPASSAMHQFDAVVSSIASSNARHLIQLSTAGRLPVTAGVSLVLILFVSFAPILGTYVNRLRRAGYIHAARSDVSALNIFATPVKVSFAWAVSPAASSSFYSSRQSVASG